MSVTRTTVIAEAKSIAQDPGGGSKLLLVDPTDYELCVDQALDFFRVDRPNRRIFHHTVIASAFRFVLQGAGAILPTSGLNAWVEGGSRVVTVYHPYDITSQTNTPLDPNTWQEKREPSLVILELLAVTPSSGVLRLEYTVPHIIHASDAAQTSILASDVKAITVLTAVKLCETTSRRYVQNTGTSTFQNETIDRRTQSDIMASRAKELMKTYNSIMGKGTGEDTGPPAAHFIKKFEIAPTHGRGRLWPVR